MALAPLSAVLEVVTRNNMCVGCFSAYSFEFIKAIIAAANMQKTPVVVSLGAHNFNNPSQLEILAMTSVKLAKTSELPVAVHLNHCRNLNLVEQIAPHGFTSIMFDGSSLPYTENLAATRKVVKIAHDIGASVEGEIRLASPGQVTDDIKISPNKAAEFARETGIDCLAASIGDGHGMKDGEGRLDFFSIENLTCLLDIPLALHKGSSIKGVDLQKAISLGVRKVNFNSELQSAFHFGLDSALRSKPLGNTTDVLQSGYQELFKKIQEKIRILQ
jgi:fructose-bisphosphate aldolase class II